MPNITTFDEAETYLLQYVRAGNEPGGYKLDRISAAMEYLGNPQNTYRVIHVAGTSGKTSTCYYIAAMLRAGGYMVGHTVSPHVDTISERAQINLQTLPEREYCAKLTTFLGHIQPSNIELSYFELLVAFAYWLFAEEKVEYAVVEVGLGGLLDGTNVVTRQDKVCVITDIGFDHVEILGKTLPEIAAQKAGIIHEKNPVFMYHQSEDVMAVVTAKSQAFDADMHIIEPAKQQDITASLPLFQQRNWHLASIVAGYVLQRDNHPDLSQDELEKTLQTSIPARMEVMKYQGKTIVLDGSHNEQKIGALVDSMVVRYPSARILVLASFGENKSTSLEPAIQKLHELTGEIVFTEFARGQDEIRTSLSVDEMAAIAVHTGFTLIEKQPNPRMAFDFCMKETFDVLLITGSFYLLNYLRPLFLHPDTEN